MIKKKIVLLAVGGESKTVLPWAEVLSNTMGSIVHRNSGILKRPDAGCCAARSRPKGDFAQRGHRKKRQHFFGALAGSDVKNVRRAARHPASGLFKIFPNPLNSQLSAAK